MIIALAIVGYVVIGMATGRYTAGRRRRNGSWCDGDEDDIFACGLAAFFWPLALASFFMMADPKPKKPPIMTADQLDKMEKELGIGD